MTIEARTLSDSAIRALAARIDRPVVLVGMMGVGKSTVGRKLAQLLGLPFADADDEIEQAAQMSVSEIFETFGEPYFRDGERRVIARLRAARHARADPRARPGNMARQRREDAGRAGGP